MRTRAELALAAIDHAHAMFAGNLRNLTLDEALSAAGGYRSLTGILKHAASWSHVYHSYAFDAEPRHLRSIDWPRGLRDTIETKQQYVDDLIAWYEASHEDWKRSLAPLPDDSFDEPRPCHWGATAPLWEIVNMTAAHWSYHAGEINAILSILRGEAWEYSEEVEENHISTAGHRLRPNWMTPQQAAAYESHLARRDTELHGG
jgi:hypothetical protein